MWKKLALLACALVLVAGLRLFLKAREITEQKNEKLYNETLKDLTSKPFNPGTP